MCLSLTTAGSTQRTVQPTGATNNLSTQHLSGFQRVCDCWFSWLGGLHHREAEVQEARPNEQRASFEACLERSVYGCHGSCKHRCLGLLEDALCGEIERVGAAVRNAKSALRFGNLGTSLVEARNLVRFVCGPWQCLREVSGNLEWTSQNRLERTMYSEFELLRSSFDEELKQFLWRAALCQFSPGTHVGEEGNGRPTHVKSEVAFQTLRRSTQ